MNDMDEHAANASTMRETLSKKGFLFYATLVPFLFSKKNGKWFGDDQADGAFSPTRGWESLAAWADFFSHARTVFLIAVLLIVSCAFVWMVYKEVRKTAVTVHPVPVPEIFSKRGYTTDVVAAHLAAELQRIDNGSVTIKSRRPIVENRSEIEFQVPGSPFHSAHSSGFSVPL